MLAHLIPLISKILKNQRSSETTQAETESNLA